MEALQLLLDDREIHFDAVKNRVRCFAHIINLCSAHVIASLSPRSSRTTTHFSQSNHDSKDSSGGLAPSADCCDDSDSEFEPDVDSEDDARDLFESVGNSRSKEWAVGFKRKPLVRARKLIRVLRSSDQRRTKFTQFINDGNERGWFPARDKEGKRIPGETTKVRNVQLLRDVKTRWDSVYLMLERLRDLRPVGFLIDRTVETG